MYFLSDKNPVRKTKSEKMTIGRVKMNSSFDTSKRIPNAIRIKAEKMCVFLTLVFSNFDKKRSDGNKNDINNKTKTKLNKILSLLLKINSVIWNSLNKYGYYRGFEVFFQFL